MTYVAQRAESMMGLFFLLMMYCYVRGITERSWLWWPLAMLAALASGLCKEVAVTAPVVEAAPAEVRTEKRGKRPEKAEATDEKPKAEKEEKPVKAGKPAKAEKKAKAE